MIAKRIELLRKQKLISKKNLEKRIGEYSSKSSDEKEDEEKIEKAAAFFNVSTNYLKSDFNYHVFLRFGNIFISVFCLISTLVMLLTFNINQDGHLFTNFLISVFVFLTICPILFYYRHFRLSLLLFIPLFISIYLIGYYSFIIFVATH
ncbi:MAG TPA: hypothetical protein GX010_02645 [Erysipelotrichaceae bacterium]|nr:hypothetical protein [Erysipelotrichaceae bacterium]